MNNNNKPDTCQGDLRKLPPALKPLRARDQWTVWRWVQQDNGNWQKPPFQAHDPQRHASSKKPTDWCSYAEALAVVEAGKADGLGYVLTTADPFAAFDLDDCRTPDGSVAVWAQNFLDVCRTTYSEVTPSGTGIRIWGRTDEGTTSVHRKFSLEDNGKRIAAELFRRTPKVLTVTGLWLDHAIKELTNIDKAFDWALIWGERRKATAAEAAQINEHAFLSNGPGHDVEHIEQLVFEGAPAGADPMEATNERGRVLREDQRRHPEYHRRIQSAARARLRAGWNCRQGGACRPS